MTKIFIDSDILIDFLIDRQPFSESSTKIISLCSENKIKLINLLKFIDIVESNKATVLNALYSDFNDFEDALQNYAVENTEIKIIITRNIKDYKKSKLSVYTPDSFLKTLSND